MYGKLRRSARARSKSKFAAIPIFGSGCITAGRYPTPPERRRPWLRRALRPAPQIGNMKMKKAIFIDRDGTLIEEVGYLKMLEDLRFTARATSALRIFSDL